MAMRSMVRLAGAIVLATVLGLGVPAPTPAAADPADTYLPFNTLSAPYAPHGCQYKVAYGNYGATAYALAHVYNLSACGTYFTVGLRYLKNSQIVTISDWDVVATGSDECGSYEIIQVTGPSSSIALNAFIAFQVAGYHRWYAANGTHNQPSISC